MKNSEIRNNTKKQQTIKDNAASVKGLVLVGGKSSRMGKDKAQLSYFGKPQKENAKSILEACGLKTFYSIGYSKTTPSKTYEIADVFDNKGPLGGICSAFQKNQNNAWLVLATDLPFVDKTLVKLLLENRNPEKVATTVKGINKDFIEPLLTIYEPKIYPILLKNLENGFASPLKILKKSDVEIIEVEDHYLKNINTPQEFIKAKKELDGN